MLRKPLANRAQITRNSSRFAAGVELRRHTLAEELVK